MPIPKLRANDLSANLAISRLEKMNRFQNLVDLHIPKKLRMLCILPDNIDRKMAWTIG